MKEINIEELKEESKKLNLQIKELEKKYITPIKNKKKKIDAVIENTIQCPKCKKHFKYVNYLLPKGSRLRASSTVG